MKILKLLLIAFLFATQVYAQDSPITTLDIIYLKNGSVFQGKILEYEKGESLILELKDATTLEFKESEIDRVVQKAVETDISEEVDEQGAAKKPEKIILKRYKFREKGYYNATYFSSSSGWNQDELQIGLGAHNVTGYQFNRMFGLGFGFGIDAYSFDEGEVLYPVFVEVRGYLKEKWHTPYYSLNVGYGFAILDEESENAEATGGIMIHPAIGFRFGANKDTNVLMDIGYKFQRAEFTRDLRFSGDRELREILFKRMTFRLGLLF